MLTLEEAVKLHGHLGPFLVIGYRAGLYARRLLGSTSQTLTCRVKLPLRKPYACIIDGVQSSTGCTAGKLNIHIEDCFDFSIELRDEGGGRGVMVKARKTLIEKVEEELAKGLDPGKLAMEVVSVGDEELFEEPSFINL